MDIFLLRVELVLHGEQNQGHSTGEVCWKYICILLWFISHKSRINQIKIVVELTPSLQA